MPANMSADQTAIQQALLEILFSTVSTKSPQTQNCREAEKIAQFCNTKQKWKKIEGLSKQLLLVKVKNIIPPILVAYNPTLFSSF